VIDRLAVGLDDEAAGIAEINRIEAFTLEE
jgi:hypothetical protein